MMEADLMNKCKVRIWERDFELDIVYQNFLGEEVTENQLKTVEALVSVDFSGALISVEKYIRKWNFVELGDESITNIFKYVMPKSILIPREDDKRLFAVLCNYRFDMEHGIAVVFQNEILKEVGPQDIIL